jgi:hypothetical protein
MTGGGVSFNADIKREQNYRGTFLLWRDVKEKRYTDVHFLVVLNYPENRKLFST